MKTNNINSNNSTQNDNSNINNPENNQPQAKKEHNVLDSNFITGIITDDEKLINQSKLSETLNSVKIDFTKEIPPPPVCLKLVKDDETSIIGTLGNYSLIIGKAKSRKSFLMAMVTSASVKNSKVFNLIEGNLPKDKSKVLYFDTEQGDYHVSKAAKRICKVVNNNNPLNLEVYCLRKFKPSERLELIEAAIYKNDDVGFVVIDGIKDLVTSINDEEQATMITSKLLKWTEEKKLHLTCVLHQNKGDNNARGHLGTELVNKAETVLSVTKEKDNKDVSIVEAEYCRDKEPKPFAFKIDEIGLPVVIDEWETQKEKYDTQKGVTPLQLSDNKHLLVLRKIFSKTENPKHKDLISNIKLEFEINFQKKFGDNKAKDFINYYLTEKHFLSKVGKDNSPKAYYVFNDPNFDKINDDDE